MAIRDSVTELRRHLAASAAVNVAPSPCEGACTDSAPLSKNWCIGLDSNQDLPGFNRALCPLSYRCILPSSGGGQAQFRSETEPDPELGAGADSNCPSAVTTRRAVATPTRTSFLQSRPQTEAGTPYGVPAASYQAVQPRGGLQAMRSWPASGR
jgi:hypothetical protein